MNPEAFRGRPQACLRPFLHVTRALSSRWFVRRWHANRDFYAWRGQRAHAGISVRVGWWLIQVALLEHRREVTR